jgi:phosphopantothenoylcysteine decarboxylase/phosphopantothenate--cysteine ligase
LRTITVVLGITGGIAAYKTPELIRSLRKQGIDVEVIMTESAQQFVTPVTLREVSGRPVHTGLFDSINQWDVQHISLAQKADLVAVVPATANIIGKMASGIADDLLTSVLMATKAPILLAPAMNCGMYTNLALQENLERLKKWGVNTVGPNSGSLLCGQDGIGRLADLSEIEERIITLLSVNDLSGLKVLVTAGPTQEYWDPVRFLTNPSSGRMGYELARNARRRGAEVILVSGPTELPSLYGVDINFVRTTEEMHQAVMDLYKEVDILVMAAAPTDYTPCLKADKKIKRNGSNVFLELKENPDIAAKVGEAKEERTLVIFAAETNDLLENARKKLISKKADMVVANDLNAEDSGFQTTTNRAILLTCEEEVELPVMPKQSLAEKIFDAVLLIRNGQNMSGVRR